MNPCKECWKTYDKAARAWSKLAAARSDNRGNPRLSERRHPGHRGPCSFHRALAAERRRLADLKRTTVPPKGVLAYDEWLTVQYMHEHDQGLHDAEPRPDVCCVCSDSVPLRWARL